MTTVQDAPGGAENTRGNNDERKPCLRRNYRQFFVSWFSEVNGERQRMRCAWNVEAPQISPCPAACVSLWRLPSVFGDDMRRLHGQSGHESTDCTLSVVHCVGGWKNWPMNMCSNKDAGRSQRETPTSSLCAQAHAGLPSKTRFSQRTKEHSMWKSLVG